MLKKITFALSVVISLSAAQNTNNKKFETATIDYLDQVAVPRAIQDIIRGYLNLAFEPSYTIPIETNYSMRYSPDGQYLLAQTKRQVGKNNLYLWDMQNKDIKRSFEVAGLLQFALSNNQIAYGTRDNQEKSNGIVITDIATGEQLSSQKPAGIVQKMVFSPEGVYFASGDWGDNVRLFLTQKYVMGRTFGLTGRPNSKCIAFSSDNKFLAASCGKTIKVWETNSTGALYADFSAQYNGHDIIAIAFKDDKLIVLDMFGIIAIFRISEKRLDNHLNIWDGKRSQILSKAVFSKDHNRIAWQRHETHNELFITHTNGESIQTIETPQPIYDFEFCSDNQTLIVKCNASIFIYDVDSSVILQEISSASGNKLNAVALSPDGNYLAIGGEKQIQTLELNKNYKLDILRPGGSK